MRPLATWDPTTETWGTKETDLFSEHWVPYSATLPTSGTTRGGQLYELPTPELPTDGPVSSSSPGRNLATPTAAIATGGPPQDSKGKRDLRLDLLPTPIASDAANPPSPQRADERARQFTRGVKLSEHLLRTPTAQLAVNGGSQHPDKRKAGGHGPTLADEVEHLLPTPTAQEPGGIAEQYHERLRKSDGRDSTFLPLSMAVQQLLPTPTAMDSHSSGDSSPSDVTLTDAVVWTSLGARTNPRFDAGRQPYDVPLPLPLSTGSEGSRD
jgi:hypothetical protein